MEAAQERRQRSNPLSTDWETVKDNIMLEAIKAKFFQHPNLMKILVDTGDAIIIEYTASHNYWADAGNGTGKNMLGILLMHVRNQIRNILSKTGNK